MKNESEQQCGVARRAQTLDTEIETLPCVGVADGDVRDVQALQEGVSALNLWGTDQGGPSAHPDGPQSNSACDNMRTGALSAERGAGAAAVMDTELSKVLPETKWQHYCEAELSSRSTAELHASLQQLRGKIEEVSAELVVLLQERQRLREEVPIRNVTIAQLLKVHEQLQLNFTEPLAIQMSVVFPDHNEVLDCL